jgi:chemotaxis response regulator CheB
VSAYGNSASRIDESIESVKPSSEVPFPKGSKVIHARFGEGLVVAVDGMGDDGRVQVRFCDATRWLLLSVAKLERWQGE